MCGGRCGCAVEVLSMNRLQSPLFVGELALLACAAVACVSCASKGVEDVEWVGHTYQLSIADYQWSEPRGLGDDIGPYIPTFLVKVEGSGNEIDATLTIAAGGKQDPCNKTVHVDAKAAYPSATLGPVDFGVRLVNDDPSDSNPGVEVYAQAYDFTLTDILPGAGGVGVLQATMDAREIFPLFTLLGEGATADDLCDELMKQTSGAAECQPCPKDGKAYCLTLKSSRLEATEFAGPVQDRSSLAASCK